MTVLAEMAMAPNATITAPSGTFFPLAAVGPSPSTFLALHQVTWATPGNLSGLRVYVSANGVTASTTVGTALNGSTISGNLQVSIGSSATGEFEDVTGSEPVTTGDLAIVRATVPNAGSSITILDMQMSFVPTTGPRVVRYGCASRTSVSTASQHGFLGLGGINTASTTEAFVQTRWRSAGSFSNLDVNVGTNARSTATTCTLRIASADSTLTVSVAAGATGHFADTTHAPTVAAGDLVCFDVLTGTGTGTFTTGIVSMDFVSFDTSYMTVAANTTGFAGNSGDHYATVGGVAVMATAETGTQHKARAGATCSGYMVEVATNGIGSATSVTFRKNGADVTQTISIGSTATGRFEDTTHTDHVAPGDLINHHLVPPGSSASNISVRVISMRVLPDASLVMPSLNRRNVLVRR